jgi:hypothetical protein
LPLIYDARAHGEHGALRAARPLVWTRRMDIDTVISELDRILHYRGREGLVEAVAMAPKLLKQERYQAADDPRESLAADIRAAVRRLPKDLQAAANGILPIDKPNAYIIGRLRSLGIGGYSNDAVRWHRAAVLGRVAGELVKLYAPTPPSYRILDLDINVWEQAAGPSVGFGPWINSRAIEFRWTLESLVSDLRWFGFSYPTPPRLKFIRMRRHMPGDAAAIFRDNLPRAREYDWDQIPHASDSRDVPGYLLRLSDTPPPGTPIALYVRLDFYKADKGVARFDYVPTEPLRRLSLSFSSDPDGKRTCVELDETARTILREFAVKPASFTEEPEQEGEVEYTLTQAIDRFRVRSPQVGRCYRLTW